jgi:hypothetical protein
MMDLVPLLYVIRMMEMSLFFLIRGLLATIPTISTALAVSLTSHVDLPIVLLLL